MNSARNAQVRTVFDTQDKVQFIFEQEQLMDDGGVDRSTVVCQGISLRKVARQTVWVAELLDKWNLQMGKGPRCHARSVDGGRGIVRVPVAAEADLGIPHGARCQIRPVQRPVPVHGVPIVLADISESLLIQMNQVAVPGEEHDGVMC